MNNVVWHKVREFDYPQPYKTVLILLPQNKMTTGYYKGELDSFPWYLEDSGTYAKTNYPKAWCEMPRIPADLME